MVFEEKFEAAVFVTFMRWRRKQVDGHPVHRPSEPKRFVKRRKWRLRLIQLPGHCPQLSPDELKQDVKTNVVGKTRPTRRGKFMHNARRHLRWCQKQPQVLRRRLFREKPVRYADR